MGRASTRNAFPHLLFACIAIGVYAAALAVAAALPHLPRPGAVAVGLTLDLVVVVPLAFYLLVVRRRGWPVATLVPVLVASVAAAARILPDDRHQALNVVEILAVPLELGIVGWISWRAARALRAARRGDTADPLEQFRRAAIELVGHERVAEVVASEIAVLHYGLGAWRARPDVPAGASAFTHHRRSGYAGIAFVFLLVIAVETAALHLLVAMWSAPTAWVLTIASVYGSLWLVADYRATALRPILVTEENVHLRAGLRWDLHVPRERIADVVGEKPQFGKASLNLTVLGAPTHWIVLDAPTTARGPYGFRRRVLALGVQPDEAEEFCRVLGTRPA